MAKQIFPQRQVVFWCNNCDAKHVDSENTSTGFFFVQFGHQYDAKKGGYEGEYVGVMFAVCNECLED